MNDAWKWQEDGAPAPDEGARRLCPINTLESLALPAAGSHRNSDTDAHAAHLDADVHGGRGPSHGREAHASNATFFPAASAPLADVYAYVDGDSAHASARHGGGASGRGRAIAMATGTRLRGED
jgi:hypothetical protein